jgi:hypothetical protein
LDELHYTQYNVISKQKGGMIMKKLILVALVVMFVLAMSGPSYAVPKMKIVTETFFVDSSDPGIKLYVRNKHLSGKKILWCEA